MEPVIRAPAAEVRRREDARAVLEDDEVARVYFQSSRISFAAAVLPAGGSSPLDPGHPGAHEVLYCASGAVELHVGDPPLDRIRLEAGDAVLIHDAVPHRVVNDGDVDAQLTWSAAPGWGRVVVPDTP